MVPVWVLRYIKGAEIGVYVSLRSFADRNGAGFPTTKKIAERAGVAISTTRNTIQKMRDLGILSTRERRRSDGSLSGLHYFLIDIEPKNGGGVPPGSDLSPPAETPSFPSSDQVTPPSEGGHSTKGPKNTPREHTSSEHKEHAPVASDELDSRDDIREVLDHFNESLVRRGCKPKKRTKSDKEAARLLLDVDGLTVSKIKGGIDWAAADSFWSAHILSLAKFRQKYETLRISYEKASAGRSGRHVAYQNPTNLDAYLEDL